MKHLLLCMMLSAALVPTQAQVSTSTVDSLPVSAPTPSAVRFGYFSYTASLQAMPGYGIAAKNMEDLRAKYDNEMKRVESEFNKKYEEFLEGQRDFAPSILQKRQAELQELMQKNMAFKQESQRLLRQAEAETFKPLKERLALAIQKIGREHGYAFIINTDENTVPYINPGMGTDISPEIANNLK